MGCGTLCDKRAREASPVVKLEAMECAICGTGILLGLIFVLAHLPLILLMFPVTVLFLGIVADPNETHAVWYGMLNTGYFRNRQHTTYMVKIS